MIGVEPHMDGSRVVWKYTIDPRLVGEEQRIVVPFEAQVLHVDRNVNGRTDCAVWMEVNPDDENKVNLVVFAAMTGVPIPPLFLYMGSVVMDGWFVLHFYGKTELIKGDSNVREA